MLVCATRPCDPRTHERHTAEESRAPDEGVAAVAGARRIDAAQLEVGRELRGAGYEAGPGRRAPE